MPDLVRALSFKQLARVAEAEARRLRRAGAQVIVAVAHSSGECERRGDSVMRQSGVASAAPSNGVAVAGADDIDDEGGCHGELFDGLVRRLPGGLIDAVVAGHSHQALWNRVNGTLVAQACSHGLAVGHIELVVDLERGQVDREASRVRQPILVCHDVLAGTASCDHDAATGSAAWRSERNPLLAKHAKKVERVTSMIAHYRSQLGEPARRVLAYAARPLVHRRFEPSEPGVVFAAALLQSVSGADAAVLNAGAIRADFPAGAITFEQVFVAHPFDNRIASVDVTAGELKQILARMVRRGHGIPPVAGLTLFVDCDQRGMKLRSVLDGARRPLDEKRLYKVVLNEFMLAGGDGLAEVFAGLPEKRKKVHASLLVREAIVSYLQGLSGPLNTPESPVVRPDARPFVIGDGSCRPRSGRELRVCR